MSRKRATKATKPTTTPNPPHPGLPPEPLHPGLPTLEGDGWDGWEEIESGSEDDERNFQAIFQGAEPDCCYAVMVTTYCRGRRQEHGYDGLKPGELCASVICWCQLQCTEPEAEHLSVELAVELAEELTHLAEEKVREGGVS